MSAVEMKIRITCSHCRRRRTFQGAMRSSNGQDYLSFSCVKCGACRVRLIERNGAIVAVADTSDP